MALLRDGGVRWRGAECQRRFEKALLQPVRNGPLLGLLLGEQQNRRIQNRSIAKERPGCPFAAFDIRSSLFDILRFRWDTPQPAKSGTFTPAATPLGRAPSWRGEAQRRRLPVRAKVAHARRAACPSGTLPAPHAHCFAPVGQGCPTYIPRLPALPSPPALLRRERAGVGSRRGCAPAQPIGQCKRAAQSPPLSADAGGGGCGDARGRGPA